MKCSLESHHLMTTFGFLGLFAMHTITLKVGISLLSEHIRHFLGYLHGQKVWKVYDIERKQLLVSHDVVFYEHQFPWTHNGPNQGSHSHEDCYFNQNHDPLNCSDQKSTRPGPIPFVSSSGPLSSGEYVPAQDEVYAPLSPFVSCPAPGLELSLS